MSSSILDLSKLRDIGWSMWDPIGLIPDGCTWRDDDAAGFEDEYDSYLQNAAAQLRQGAPAAEVVNYLVKVETVLMSISQRPDTMLRARAVVQAILAEA
ncbi:hypothetical protein [Rhizobium sp. S163]|uniref:hypothetical protein n=1 Tax=Rhizobium sp. S163 TaxID=3055039 RepID=UPI0025A9727B|nr:hypothetical protein [Rhizobium sp. S163]MDM9644144.1 hypothetical protein [Rhizobium sp. S163]